MKILCHQSVRSRFSPLQPLWVCKNCDRHLFWTQMFSEYFVTSNDGNSNTQTHKPRWRLPPLTSREHRGCKTSTEHNTPPLHLHPPSCLFSCLSCTHSRVHPSVVQTKLQTLICCFTLFCCCCFIHQSHLELRLAQLQRLALQNAAFAHGLHFDCLISVYVCICADVMQVFVPWLIPTTLAMSFFSSNPSCSDFADVLKVTGKPENIKVFISSVL